jgi:hypothetical protein
MAKLASARRRRRIFRYALWVVTALLATVAFAVATPYLLIAVSHIRPTDWGQFSNEGQAYGGIAAVIGMLAIVGVAASLFLQTRDAAVNRAQADRASYENIVQLSLDDPDLLACWGPSDRNPKEYKQQMYTNMIVSYWNFMFRLGNIGEPELRSVASDMFAGVPGRKYWQIAGPLRKAILPSDPDQKFVTILNEAYQKTVADGLPVEWPGHVRGESRLHRYRTVIYGATLGVVCGTVIGATFTSGRHSS